MAERKQTGNIMLGGLILAAIVMRVALTGCAVYELVNIGKESEIIEEGPEKAEDIMGWHFWRPTNSEGGKKEILIEGNDGRYQYSYRECTGGFDVEDNACQILESGEAATLAEVWQIAVEKGANKYVTRSGEAYMAEDFVDLFINKRTIGEYLTEE